MIDPAPVSDESALPDDVQSEEVTTAPTKPRSGCVRACLSFSVYCLLVGAGFVLMIGALLRLTIRDSIPYLSVFYYATPLIVPALAAAVLCFNRVFHRRWRAASAWGILALCLFGWWHWHTDYSHPPQNETAGSQKLLFWNVSYVDAGWPAIISELQKHDADVIGLVEVGGGYPHILNNLRAAFPEHQLCFAGHGILLVRGSCELLERGSLNDSGEYAVIRVRLSGGRQFDTLLVDIYGFVLMPRGPALRALQEVLSQRTNEPVCLMGDFNTPPDSVFFRPIRTRFENSFEASGNGYHVTWPAVAPVLALDQIWLPPGTSTSSQLITTSLSDHRIVTATAQLENGNPHK